MGASEMEFTGKSKVFFCQNLGKSWPDLADLAGIPEHIVNKFTAGEEAREIWEWLENRGQLGKLPNFLRDPLIDRAELADKLILSQHSQNRGGHDSKLGQEMDYLWLAALVDKRKQADKVRKLLGEYSAFIVAGEPEDWPEAVADRLAYELCSEDLNRPRKLLWAPRISTRDMEAGGLLRCILHKLLTEGAEFRDANLEDILACLRYEPQPMVFSLKIGVGFAAAADRRSRLRQVAAGGRRG
jgi:hypothetical protein